MNNDPRMRDPIDPRDPAVDPAYQEPRSVHHTTTVAPRSGRGGLALAAVLAALLVIGFIAFTGNNEGVDPNPTAATGTQTTIEVEPGAAPAAPSADQIRPQTEAPAAAPEPQENNPAGTGTAPAE